MAYLEKPGFFDAVIVNDDLKDAFPAFYRFMHSAA